jgi:3-phenylpropionate/trans-cinnamate dioxygenase ferredoxin reductase subunit
MAHYPYLVVGGGMTAAAAIRGIREIDSVNPIGLIGSESHPPYQRPPLSKALWKGKPLDRVWIDLSQQGVDRLLGRKVQALDVEHKRVTDDQGSQYRFDKLLLATGGTPRRLAWGGDDVIYYRTLDDYQRLRALAEQGQRFAVIGGGFIGSEIAAALAMNGKQVVRLFPGAGLGEHAFGPELSAFLNEYYEQHGVEVMPGETAVGLERSNGQIALQTRGGEKLLVDGVVAGIGIEPNIELARTAGLNVEDGIIVDALVRTSNPDIYAAGYDHLPFFYSDLFDLGYEAVGELDARLDIVADWKVPFREGVLYYLREGRVRGVLLWNVWEQVDAARRLIAEPGPFQPIDLRGRLPA